jgi:phosphoglucosamine mutase
VAPDALGKAERVVDAAGRYIEFCKSTIPSRLSLGGLKIVVDCAHGATYGIAPLVFEELAAEVITIGTAPDGLNINEACGSTSPEQLQQRVLQHQADLGIALDGDGDRLIMVDHKGEVVDGDELLFIIATARMGRAGFKKGVVGTVMSNLGLEHALQAQGIELHRAAVGDRYVMELLRQGEWSLGGESSGHIICLDHTTTGDGIVAALQVLAAVVETGKSLHELKSGMEKYPQTLINVRTEQRFDFANSAVVKRAVQEVEARLNGTGRILLRASGTEPVIRVMVEGRDGGLVQQCAQYLADQVEAAYTQS